VRAKEAGAVVILGSATPSLESLHNSTIGKLKRLVMGKRATSGARLPEVEVVDMRGRPHMGLSDGSPFSPVLEAALEETVASGNQGILFLNRRGFNTVVLCRACGESISCPSCSVGLTHHRASGVLRCHYCDHAMLPSSICPSCGEDAVGLLGLGTQKVEEAVRKLLPGARVARMDRDALGGKSPAQLVDAMREGRIDVLVGTQMVAKGHDFPGVTLVGVVLADLGLGLPDFRAGERTFQLLTQVAGRAGRGNHPGHVIIQTYNPEHYAVASACSQDYEGFAANELEIRRVLGFPPFGFMAAIRVEDPDEERARRTAHDIGKTATDALLKPGAPPASVLGPAPAPIARLRGRYRWQILFRADRRSILQWLITGLKPWLTGEVRGAGSAARVVLDIDPVNML